MLKALTKLIRVVIIFAAGVVVGYVLRDRGADQDLDRAVRAVRTEMESAARDAADRARRAGEELVGRERGR